MLNHCTQQSDHGPARCPALRFPSSSSQPCNIAQLHGPPDELRAVKERVAEAYGFRMGGAPLKQIASDMEVSTSRAGELLDVTHPRRLTEKYLANIAKNNAAVASKLGIAGSAVRSVSLAGERRAA